jgi:hypothetical protein
LLWGQINIPTSAPVPIQSRISEICIGIDVGINLDTTITMTGVAIIVTTAPPRLSESVAR